MIKLVYCIRRRSDVPEDEFRRYWLEEHGPLVRSVAEAIRARRYVQSHTAHPDLNEALTASRGAATPYDGITEVWFEGRESLTEGLASPEAQAATKRLLEDEARFIDLTASTLFLTEEHDIFDLR